MYGMPRQYEVLTTVHHDDCGKELPMSYEISLPSQLDRLDDECSSSSTLDDWRRHLWGKNWCNLVVMDALNSWEPVSNDAKGPDGDG